MRKLCLRNDVSFIHLPVSSTFFIICYPLHKLPRGVGIAYIVFIGISNGIIDISECGAMSLIIEINSSFLACFGVIFRNVIVGIFLIGNDTIKRIVLNTHFRGVKKLIVGVKKHIPCFAKTFKACGFTCSDILNIHKSIGVGNALIALFTQFIHKIHILNVINYPADKGCVAIPSNRYCCAVGIYSSRKFYSRISRKNIGCLQCRFGIGIDIFSLGGRQVLILSISDNSFAASVFVGK